MTNDENTAPSPETLQQINEGVNFVCHWLSERHAAGKMTTDEYNQALEKIRNTKIFPTGRGSDRLIDAYQQGELKLSDAYIKKGLSVEDLKNGLLKQSSYAGEMLGLSTFWSDNPAILIDINKIKSENSERSDLSSVVAHELTHCLGLKDTSEKEVQNILYGRYKQTTPTTDAANSNKPNISVQIIPDSGTQQYVHGSKKIARSGEKPYGIKLNENVIYDPYEDKESEVYARIMQMRFDLKLDPRKIYTPEDVEELRKNLLKKQMEGKLTGADKDINNLIFKRYSDEQISHFLNDTAQFQQIPNNENNYLADIKQIMHKDTENYLKVIASINNPARSFSPTPQNSHKEKTNSTPLLRQQREYC